MASHSSADLFILPVFEWLDHTSFAAWVKASVWLVPFAGSLHLIALAILGGALFMVDLRVLGFGVRSQNPSELCRMVTPIMLAGLCLAILSGLCMAAGELMKLYYSPPYWLKIPALIAALVFTFGVRNPLLSRAGSNTWTTVVFAITALVLWGFAWWFQAGGLANYFLVGLLFLLALLWCLGARFTPAITFANKVASIVSITLWLTVAASGRWIAFY